MKNPLQFKRSRYVSLLLVFGSVWFACQSRVAQQEDEMATSSGALPATETLSQPTAGPLDPARPPEAAAPTVVQPPIGPAPKDLHHKTLQNPDGTWGYDIFGDGKLLLHQPHIPALPGNAGFQTEAQATRVAQAAIQKIKKGESLPTLSVEEVRGLMSN